MKTKICTKCNVEKDVEMFEKKYDKGSPGRRRGQCKDCRPRKKTVYRGQKKVCQTCGEEKYVTEFALYYGGRHTVGSTMAHCKKCNNAKLNVIARKNSSDWKQWAGGRCIRCGYDRCMAALDFHHRDPSTKLFQLSLKLPQASVDSNSSTAGKIRSEIGKCDLLCSNCHREEHSGFNGEDGL